MISEIETVVDSHIHKFMDIVSVKFIIEKKQLQHIWEEVSGKPLTTGSPSKNDFIFQFTATKENPSFDKALLDSTPSQIKSNKVAKFSDIPSKPSTVTSDNTPETPVPKATKSLIPKAKKSSSIPEISKTTCTYIIQRGEQKGKMCGCKSVVEGFCSKHKKYYVGNSNVADNDKNSDSDCPSSALVDDQHDPLTLKHPLSLSKKVSSKKETKKETKKESKESSSDELSTPSTPPGVKLSAQQVSRYVTHSTLGVLWNPNTTFTISSATNKTVVGKIRDGKIVPLETKDITICKKYYLEYCEDLPELEADKEDCSEEDCSEEDLADNDEE